MKRRVENNWGPWVRQRLKCCLISDIIFKWINNLQSTTMDDRNSDEHYFSLFYLYLDIFFP